MEYGRAMYIYVYTYRGAAIWCRARCNATRRRTYPRKVDRHYLCRVHAEFLLCIKDHVSSSEYGRLSRVCRLGDSYDMQFLDRATSNEIIDRDNVQLYLREILNMCFYNFYSQKRMHTYHIYANNKIEWGCYGLFEVSRMPVVRAVFLPETWHHPEGKRYSRAVDKLRYLHVDVARDTECRDKSIVFHRSKHNGHIYHGWQGRPIR